MLTQLKKVFHTNAALFASALVLVVLSCLLLPQITFAQTQINVPSFDTLDLGIWDKFSVAGLVSGVTWLFAKLGIILLSLSAYILDFGIKLGAGLPVFGFRNGVYRLDAIASIWVVLRDMANLAFIFILVWIAVRVILGLDSSAQKRVVSVIIIALVINFSAFVTKVAIDVGNALTVVAYNQIVTTGSGQAVDGGVANVFLAPLKFQTLFAPETIKSLQSGEKLWSFSIICIFIAVISFAAAYVFLVGALLFLVRTVKLIQCILLSPLAFISYVIPGLEGYFGKWRDDVIKYTMVGPVYMIAILLVANIIKQLAVGAQGQGTGIGASIVDLVVNGNFGEGLNLLFVLGMMIYFMLWSVWASEAVAGDVTKIATHWADKAKGMIAGSALRSTVGWASAGLGKKYDQLEARIQGSKFAQSKYVKGAATFANVATLGVAGGLATSLNEGARAALKKGEEAKFGSSYSFKSRKETDEAHAKFLAETKKKYDTKERISHAIKAVTDKSNPYGYTQEQLQEELQHIQQTIPKLSDKEIEALGADTLKNPEVIASLTPSQVEALKKSEKLSETQKEEILKARRAPINDALENLSEALREGETPEAAKERVRKAKETIQGITDKELEKLPPDLLARPEFIQQLSSSQANALQKSEHLTALQKQAIKKTRMSPIVTAFGTETTHESGGSAETPERKKALNIIRNIKSMDDVADLDTKILIHPYVVANLYNRNYLKKLSMAKISDEKFSEIKKAIRESRNPAMTNLQTWTTEDEDGRALFA